MNCFNKVAMSCIVYMMSCNFAIHAICLLTLTTYKSNELQMVIGTQKLSCKANCKMTLFSFHHGLNYDVAK